MRWLLLLSIMLPSMARAAAGELVPGDFAEGFNLEVDRKSAVYCLELPEEVYRTVKSAALRDLLVFNRAGEAVPHDLRTVRSVPATQRELGRVPFFPLFTGIQTSSDAAGFSLQVLRDRTGAIVNLDPKPAVDSAAREITGYLLDLSGFKLAASELHFYWQKEVAEDEKVAEADSSVFTVKIEQSDDLLHWLPLVERATLADLQFGGQQIENRNIQLPVEPLKYLRLTWQEASWPLKLTGITGFTRITQPHLKRRWSALGSGAVEERDGQVLVPFATGYHLPVESVQLDFSEANSLASLSVQSRPDSRSGWTVRCEQVFFDLKVEGAALRNEPCEFLPTGDPLWRVAVVEDGAGLRSGKGKLTLQLGWQPSELVFLGRGEPPFLLAYGSGRLAQQEGRADDGMVLQALPVTASSRAISPARLGRKVKLGGEVALQEPVKPLPWKKWLLWTILLLGVGVLALMARSLMKEIKTAEEKKVSEDR